MWPSTGGMNIFISPEYGPAPYMAVRPHTQEPGFASKGKSKKSSPYLIPYAATPHHVGALVPAFGNLEYFNLSISKFEKNAKQWEPPRTNY